MNVTIACRKEILEKYLQKLSHQSKCLLKLSLKQELEQETSELHDKKLFLQLLKGDTTKWLDILFEGGYAFPPVVPTRLKTSKAITNRRDALSKRYKKWKTLRPYLRLNWPEFTNTTWYPAYKWTIFQFLNYDTKQELVTDLLLFHQMIMNYLPFYTIYQYDCIPGKGYQWYSGEPLILYYVTEELNTHQNKLQRLQQAFNQKKANGYDLTNCWKIIICTYDWKKLDLPLGTGKWKLFVFPNFGDFRSLALLYWHNYVGESRQFLKHYVFEYSRSHEVLPWPWFRSQHGLTQISLKTVGSPLTSTDLNSNSQSLQDE